MKNYKQTASDVLRLVGGEKNVVQVEHCSTRLRFTLADTSKGCSPEKDCRCYGRYFQRPAVSGGHRQRCHRSVR